MRTLRRIGRHLRHRRHVEAYIVAAASVVLAVGSLGGDVVSEDLRWATVLAALSVLTYHITVPGSTSDLDDVLHNRTSFEETSFASRLRGAKVVWIMGPSVINLLTGATAGALRSTVLNRHDGEVRVIVLDPSDAAVVELTARHIDDATDYPAEDLRSAVKATAERLAKMAAWGVAGSFEYRFMSFNPGFSIVAIDPYGRGGVLLVEFHGVHNESAASRMHIELTRAASEPWYLYWRDQFEHLWQDARRPMTPTAPGAPEELGAPDELAPLEAPEAPEGPKAPEDPKAPEASIQETGA